MARSFSEKFYKSPEWAKVRRYVLMRDRYVCQHCGRPAQEVHHKIHLTPENIWDPKITLNSENLISLCRDCHFAEHVKDKARGHCTKSNYSDGDCADGFHFDESGQLVPD